MKKIFTTFALLSVLAFLPSLARAEEQDELLGTWKLNYRVSFSGYESKMVYIFTFKPNSELTVEQLTIDTNELSNGKTSAPEKNFRIVSSHWERDGDKIVVKDVYKNDVTPDDKRVGTFDNNLKPVDLTFNTQTGFFGNYKLYSENFKQYLHKLD